MSRVRTVSVGLTLVAVLAATLPAAAGDDGFGRLRSGQCTDKVDGAIPLELQVNRETATGHYALPSGSPKGLVVFAHGYGHTSFSWIGHMVRAAREHNVVAVAMDYRGIEIKPDSNGDGLPESRGWNARAGAEDLVAAARYLRGFCRSVTTTTIFGVSMGANMSGLAVALASTEKAPDGSALFDYWFDIEGAVNVVETYAGARVLAPANGTAANAQQDIEKEMGGPIEATPETYLDRAVVSHVDEIAASGVKGVVLVHGLDDGLVPYNQSREMSSLLLQNQVPLDFLTVGRRSPESEQETTATGYVGGQLDPDYKSPLAGHASEKSTTHIIMVTAFERLWQLMDEGETPGVYREFLVDGELGTFGPLF
ncbi:MAG TPA: alpha/beta fold hydrolase [Actinomycetota bacterium]|nr:alpha/beta fold hydrolase [Actinomycetota bacterium]